MTAATCTLPGCGRPVPDQAYACPGCGQWAGRDLAAVPSLIGELETTRARLARIGEPGRGTGERALPWQERASEAAQALANEVTTLARHVASERGLELPIPGAQPAAAASARWLLSVGAVEWLRHRPEAAETFAGLAQVVRDARRVIDRQADRRYAGPCGEPSDTIVGGCATCEAGEDCPDTAWHRPAPCRGELYARPDADTVTCDVCGAEFNVQTRRSWLLASAKDELAGAAQIASLLADRQDPVEVARLAARIRKWAERGRLVAHAWAAWGRNDDEADERLHPRYRVGDVQELLKEAAEAEARERAKASA